MKTYVIAFGCGILFGLGLALSQMTNPEKVLNFLDIAGNWDPSLAFVMFGALMVTIPTFRFVLLLKKPVTAPSFVLPVKKEIDKPLIFGAALFGVGWGLAGYCPGPVVAGLGFGSFESIVLLVSIYLGFMTHRYFFDR